MGVPHASGAMNIINYSGGGGGGVRAHRYSTAEEKARGRSPTNHNNHECHYVGVPHECGAMNIINYWGGGLGHTGTVQQRKRLVEKARPHQRLVGGAQQTTTTMNVIMWAYHTLVVL